MSTKKNRVYYQNGEEIILKEEIGKGGEGIIFSIDSNIVAKIYTLNSLNEQKKQKLNLLIEKKLQFKGICLPLNALYNTSKEFIGYTMPRANVPKGFELQTCVFNPELLKLKFPSWNRLNLVNLSISILEKIEYLHANNIIIGDINPFNILINTDLEVYFVDTDSYQVENLPCPVGTVHFTAPEIQDTDNFSNLIRNKEHEYFAVATLLFMIFLPGKSPYAFQGGGDVKENIKSMNFSYPLGDEDNYMAPQGMWEFIWSELPYDIRKAFTTVFKDNYRLTIENWIEVLNTYKQDLAEEVYPIHIFPESTERIIHGRTINMNRRDIKITDTNIRNGKTKLLPKAEGVNIGILELSTKAVKFLTARQEEVKTHGFSFERFYRETDKTETGKGLDKLNFMDMTFYSEQVIPFIKKMLRLAKDKKVDILYCVATAAYRTANNRDEIIDTIREECGINVKILSKKEEATSTLTAFVFCKTPDIKFDPKLNYLMIDQGGGSSEFSLFQSNEILDSYSLNLGTTVLKNVLFKEASQDSNLDRGFKDSDKFIKDRLRTYFSNPKSSLLNKNKGSFLIANGTAITQATGKKGNPKQHCTSLSISEIQSVINNYQEQLNQEFDSTKALLEILDGPKTNNRDALDRMLVARLGLPMFIELMKQIGIEKIVINGTGLWYGVYFENLYNLNN